MSEQETRKHKGEILAELSENEQQQDQYKARAREIAGQLRSLADRLESDPTRVVFSGEDTPLEFGSTSVWIMQDVALEEIRRIRDSIRKLELRHRELKRNKQAFGA